jgi:DNA repair protein SbcC/Rad50
MNLGKLLFKARWQDKDVAIRRIAVGTDNDADLIAALPELTRADPDASVRLAALKRLNDYELWRERSTGDADVALRRTARAAYLQQLCADLPGGPALARRIAEMETLSDDELEQVATAATWRELRADALKRLRKPSLFLDRALNDNDPALRLEALHRIDDVALLDRAAERARKTDKVISRRAKELADALRIERGDAGVIAERARALCERIETLMRTSSRDVESVAAIDAQWQKLGAAIPADIARRYEGARAVILTPARKREEPIAEAPVVAPQESTEAIAPEPRFGEAASAAAEEAKRRRQQTEAQTRALSACITRFEAAVESGDTAGAAKIHAEIDALVAEIGAMPAPLHSELAPIRERESELQRWLNWSNNRRRKAICGEIEKLSAAHPDAMANRLRELRDEWTRLSALTPAPQALEQRFQNLSNRLLRSARPYFDKRDEVRRTHSDEVNRVLARADALGESDDWKSMLALRTELSTALRSLDQVEPRGRSAFAKRIKTHIDKIGARIAAHDAEVEQAKTKLIAAAEKLGEVSDARDIARQARELQKQWTALGSGRRSLDQKQWRLFRAACDAAFGKLDEQRKERDEKVSVQRAEAVVIVERLESAASSDAEADVLRTALRDAEAQWRTGADRALEQRFREARDSISRLVKDASRKKRLRRFTLALRKYRLVRSIESGRVMRESIVEEWSQIGDSHADFDGALQSRFDTTTGDTADTDAASDVLVRLESLAGVESPAHDRQRRMNLQVRRLSSRLRGGATQDTESELTALMAEWFALGPVSDAAFDERFDRAAQATIDTLP